MERCKYAKDHLFNLNEIQRKTFEYYKKKKKNPCVECKTKKDVVCIIYVRRANSLEFLERQTGVIKISSQCTGKDNYFCNKCKKSFE